jgi:hypothetical protein
MDAKSLTTEEYREYDFSGRTYRIDAPVALYVGKTTHRILDSSGIVHCVPAPGQNDVVLRWKVKAGADPVSF